MMRERSWWLSNGKNYTILKASMLVERFLTHSDQMKYVRAMPAFIVDLYLRPPNWYRWINLFKIIRNCSLSPIIFLNSFSVVFSRTIGWKDLGESYDTLLGLGMTIFVNVLKWDGQYPKSIQTLAMSMSLIIHLSFLIIHLI